MDQAKSGFIRKLFIKGRGAEIFIQIGTSPLEIPRQLDSTFKLCILFHLKKYFQFHPFSQISNCFKKYVWDPAFVDEI